MKLTSANISDINLKFNSHNNHNPNFDILELRISQDAFITYSVNIDTKDELMEYYAGENYVLNSTIKSHSRVYKKNEIPKKYLTVWNALKECYIKNYVS